MLKIPEEQKRACYASGYFRRYSFEFDGFTIGNDIIRSESVIIKESICEDTELKLGGCIASSCEFEVLETVTNNINLSGLRFRAYLHTYKANQGYNTEDVDDPDFAIGEEVGEPIPMGVFNVRSVEMIDDADYKKVTAYDDLYDWDVDVSEWYNYIFPETIKSIIYIDENGNDVDISDGIPENAIQKTITETDKISIKSLRNSLVLHLAETSKIDTSFYADLFLKTYVNDEIEVPKTIETTGNVMGLELLRYLCELAGGFGRINRYGVFEIVSLGASGGLYPENNIYPEDGKGADGNLYPEDSFVFLGGSAENEENPDLITTHYEEYNVQPISCVTFSMNSTSTSTDSDGNIVEENSIIGVSYPENDTENPYVSSNPFVLSLPVEELRKVAKNVYEKISSITYRPNTTTIQGVPYYETGDYYNVTKKIPFESYVLSRTLTGVQGLRDEFIANGLEVRENNVPPTTESYITMAKYMNIIKNNEGISIEVADMEANQKTNIDITAQEITSTVAASQYQWDDNKYQIDEYGFGEPKSFYKIKSYWDDSEYKEKRPHVEYVFKLPDVYKLTDNKMNNWYFCKMDTGILYRPQRTSGFAKDGVWIFETRAWKATAALKKTVEYIYDYSSSDVGRTYLDENTGYLYKLFGWNLSSENPRFQWNVIARLQKVSVQLQTQISQTAEEIRLEASKTYATDSYVKTQFKMTANEISSEVEARKGDSERLSSSIVQTAAQIESSVSKDSDTWMTNYRIAVRGYGVGNYYSGYYHKNCALDYPVYSGYYLDEQTGGIYRIVNCINAGIEHVYELILTYRTQATRVTESFSSRITQTENSINSIVAHNGTVDGKIVKLESRVTQTESSWAMQLTSNDSVVTAINASHEGIVLTGNRLVVQSNNFQLDRNGNATFSGNLNAAKGTFSGNLTSGGTKFYAIQDNSGHFLVAPHSSSGVIVDLSGSSYIRISQDNKGMIYEPREIYRWSDNGLIIQLNDFAQFFGNTSSQSGITTYIRGNNTRIYAHPGGGVYLGYSGSTAITSDETMKDLYELDDRYETFFNNLTPVLYIYKDTEKNKHHRKHIGFGAQSVEKALCDAGLSTKDFAGILIDKDVTITADEAGTEEDVHYDKMYSLRYEEFIALNTMMVQKLKTQIETLENKLKEMED